jgi:undecaprenyl-diphosphatase
LELNLELIKAIILGLVQGLSEFLPISSSGHLVIFSEILNFHHTGIAFEIFVHFGTLISVLLAFRKELTQMIIAPYLVWIKKSQDPEIIEFLNWDYYIIVATIPAVIIGLTLKDPIENLFSSVLLVFFTLLITATLMWSSQFLKKGNEPFTYGRTFIVGVAQAFAILPGISRSGSTIFMGMALGMDREKVAKFSFILSIPAILGATVLQLNDLAASPPSSTEIINLVAGTIVAFISGYFSIIWLLDVVKKGKLQWFGYCCFIIAVSGLLWYFLR